jgi:hypothetical protein
MNFNKYIEVLKYTFSTTNEMYQKNKFQYYLIKYKLGILLPLILSVIFFIDKSIKLTYFEILSGFYIIFPFYCLIKVSSKTTLVKTGKSFKNNKGEEFSEYNEIKEEGDSLTDFEKKYLYQSIIGYFLSFIFK